LKIQINRTVPPPIFDEAWYVSEYGFEAVEKGIDAYHQFLTEGAAKGYNPSPLFDEKWYRRQYPDVADAIRSGLLLSGYHDFISRKPDYERNPSPYFDVQWYRAKYNVPADGDRLTYFEYLTTGAKLGHDPSAHFEEIWYRAANPSAAEAIRSGKYPSAYHHYLYAGVAFNWAPNPYFDPNWYVSWYPQIDAGVAFEHYLTEGVAQGLSPNLYFDEIWYLYNNPDVEKLVEAKQVFSGHQHFLEKGEKEGRCGSPLFDSTWYLQEYPDVREYIQNGLASGPYDHFCRYGRQLGRLGGKPSQPRESALVECARRELDDFSSNHKTLELQISDSPVVSIILVGHDRPELTLRCLRSITNWVDMPHEVIMEEMLHGVAGPRVGGQSAGKYVLYLSTSAELQVGAVQSAVEILEREPDMGAVGGKIIADGGALVEAGCYLKKNGWLVQFGRGQAPFQFEFMHRRDVPFLSETFLMTRHDLLPEYHDACDYCLKLWQRGYRVVFNPESIVLLHESPNPPNSQPALSRRITSLRRSHSDYLARIPDYSVGPVSSLDGSQMRRGYLVIVDEISASSSPDILYRAKLIRQMLAEKIFITLYPLTPWLGSRQDLGELVPDEVELVLGRGVNDLAEFCRQRRAMYQGVQIWTDSEEILGTITSLKELWPDVRILAASSSLGIGVP
jgi:hypothetical protein